MLMAKKHEDKVIKVQRRVKVWLAVRALARMKKNAKPNSDGSKKSARKGKKQSARQSARNADQPEIKQ